jgi:TrpR family transcriptional regulator, trp operon repressor
MPHTEKKGWKAFIKLIQHLETPEDINHCMGLLLTHEEQYDMGKRILVVKHLLAEDMTQRDLSKKLNVSIAKITRGSNALKTITPSLRKLLTDLID